LATFTHVQHNPGGTGDLILYIITKLLILSPTSPSVSDVYTITMVIIDRCYLVVIWNNLLLHIHLDLCFIHFQYIIKGMVLFVGLSFDHCIFNGQILVHTCRYMYFWGSGIKKYSGFDLHFLGCHTCVLQGIVSG